jgi:hypothetical protein
MPPGEAHIPEYNHTARKSLSMDCCNLLDTAPKEGKAATPERLRHPLSLHHLHFRNSHGAMVQVRHGLSSQLCLSGLLSTLSQGV